MSADHPQPADHTRPTNGRIARIGPWPFLGVVTLAVLVALGAMLFVVLRGGGDDAQEPANGVPTSSPPGSAGRPLPIETVDVRIAESYPVQVFADVSGYAGDACTKPGEPRVQRDGHTVAVTILGERDPDAVCAQVVTPFQITVALGSFPETGDYTLHVNDLTTTFHVD